MSTPTRTRKPKALPRPSDHAVPGSTMRVVFDPSLGEYRLLELTLCWLTPESYPSERAARQVAPVYYQHPKPSPSA